MSATTVEQASQAANTGATAARIAEFAQLGSTGAAPDRARLDLFTDIPITLTARLGQAVLTIGELLKLGPGVTVDLNREVQQPVELVIGGKVFARGEVVVVHDRFAIRIKELAISPPGAGGLQ